MEVDDKQIEEIGSNVSFELLSLTHDYHALFWALLKWLLNNSHFQTNEFWREAEILSKLHHPNVVAFYGVVQDGPGGTLATLTEYMVDGSLRHVLLRKDRYCFAQCGC